jgi:predicted transcriptional regulator
LPTILTLSLLNKKVKTPGRHTIIIYFWSILVSKMKTISLKIDDSIFGETEKILSGMKKPRNRYINEAIDYYNRLQKRLLIEKRLKKESELVKQDSISILKEFEDVDYVD